MPALFGSVPPPSNACSCVRSIRLLHYLVVHPGARANEEKTHTRRRMCLDQLHRQFQRLPLAGGMIILP